MVVLKRISVPQGNIDGSADKNRSSIRHYHQVMPERMVVSQVTTDGGTKIVV